MQTIEEYKEYTKQLEGDAGTIARKISEACIDCMGAWLKKFKPRWKAA